MKRKKRLFITVILLLVMTILYVFVLMKNILCDKIVNYSGIDQHADITNTQYIQWNTITYIGIYLFGAILVLSIMLSREAYSRKVIALLITISLTGIPKLLQLGTKPIWDSYYYYGNFFSQILSNKSALSTFFDSFRLSTHPTYAYAPIWLIGLLYPGEHYVGFQIVNIVMSTIASLMIWDIFSVIDGGKRPKLVVMLSVLSGWLPLILACVSGISPDYGIAVFFVFLWWSYVRQKKAWFLIFSICLVFTKEIGIVILAGFWCGHVISIAIKEKKFKKILFNYYTISMIIIGIFMCAYYIYMMFAPSSPGLWGGGNVVGSEGALYFDIPYIWLKLKTWLLLDFNWLLLLIAGTFLVLCIKRGKSINSEMTLTLLGALVCFEVFDGLFHTNNGPRYVIIVELVFFLLMSIFMISSASNEKRIEIIVYIVSGLMLVSSFITIDPLTKRVFTVSETGSIPLVNLNMTGSHYNYDTVAYNYQYTFLQRMYDIILEDVNYSEDMGIIVYGERDDILHTWICGQGYDDTSTYYYGWDKASKQRVLGHPDTTKKIDVAFCSEDMYGLLKYGDDIPKEAVYISVPFFGGDKEDEAILKLSEYYEFSDRKMISCRFGGKGYYYTLRLKDEEM